jgi:hypothetical protein
LAKTSPLDLNPIGGHFGEGEGARRLLLFFLTGFLVAVAFFVAVALGVGVAFLVAVALGVGVGDLVAP